MFFAPKGSPVFNNLAVSKLKLPDVLTKLSNGGLTGYASFVFKFSTAILVFEDGRLVSVLVEGQNGKWESGVEALSTLVELIVTTGSGSLNIYKLSKNLMKSVHSLLEGEALYNVRLLKQAEIETLAEKVKEEQTSGCLRIYADEQSALFFYLDGSLGFFLDDSIAIETAPPGPRKIAGLTAMNKSAGEAATNNLLEVAAIQKIWDSSVALHRTGVDSFNPELKERNGRVESLKIAQLEEQVKTIVSKYAGKVGRGIVDKEISDNGGNLCLIADGKEKFMKNIERKLKFLVSGSNIKLMMEKLSSEISSSIAEL